jgi:hypothetical protein
MLVPVFGENKINDDLSISKTNFNMINLCKKFSRV